MFDKETIYSFAILIGLSATGIAVAQTPPDAGSLLREQKPVQVEPPKGKATLPQVTEPASPSADATPIEVKSLRVTGSTVFAAETLEALVANVAGQRRTLRELQIAAARITAHYRRAGYTLARAYLPQQKMQDGVVTIEVLEGRLEKVQTENASRLSVAKAYWLPNWVRHRCLPAGWMPITMVVCIPAATVWGHPPI
jgi:hemolysin activation/secretion protein